MAANYWASAPVFTSESERGRRRGRERYRSARKKSQALVWTHTMRLQRVWGSSSVQCGAQSVVQPVARGGHYLAPTAWPVKMFVARSHLRFYSLLAAREISQLSPPVVHAPFSNLKPLQRLHHGLPPRCVHLVDCWNRPLPSLLPRPRVTGHPQPSVHENKLTWQHVFLYANRPQCSMNSKHQHVSLRFIPLQSSQPLIPPRLCSFPRFTI